MGLKVKNISDSSKKLVERAQAASGEYATQAAASGDQWNTQVQASKDNYGMAVTAAGIKERFARGAAKCGAAGFVDGITKKGKDRFSQGVSLGQGKYQTNTEPYFSTLSGLTLSARQPKGSPANYGRVVEVGKALNVKRLALLGSGA
jgi:hypothetical protein